jgi:hypothetical protein
LGKQITIPSGIPNPNYNNKLVKANFLLLHDLLKNKAWLVFQQVVKEGYKNGWIREITPDLFKAIFSGAYK